MISYEYVDSIESVAAAIGKWENIEEVS